MKQNAYFGDTKPISLFLHLLSQ